MFEFEPGPGEILDRLLPRWLEAEMYEAMLESAASFTWLSKGHEGGDRQRR